MTTLELESQTPTNSLNPASIQKTRKRDVSYRIFLLLLSIYVLIALAVEATMNLKSTTQEILQVVDLIVCGFFLLDFFGNLWTAKSKKEYLKWGWIDLISSIPSLDTLRWGRIARLVRIIRFLRGLKSIRVLIIEFRRYTSESIFLFSIFTTLLAFMYGSIFVLEFEKGAATTTITTASDAMWWTFVNILNGKSSISNVMTEESQALTLGLNRYGFFLFAAYNALFIAWVIRSQKLGPETAVET